MLEVDCTCRAQLKVLEEDFDHVLFEVLFTNVLLPGDGGMGDVWPAGLGG